MIRSAAKKLLLLVLAIGFWGGFSSKAWGDQPITVATWNVAQIDRDVSDLDTDGFLNEVKFDILLVNEVKKQEHLDSLKAAMDIEEFHTAISSFETGNGNLEVGIISRFPLTEIVEFDRSPDNFGTAIAEERLDRPDLDGIANVGVGRGFLVAKVAALDLYLIVTHLKSSRGESGRIPDGDNARKRELVAAAIATHVQKLREDHPTCSVIVGGDFNVGVSDANKIGTDLTNDTMDGYDDTHALLEVGRGTDRRPQNEVVGKECSLHLYGR
ncbi:MAG: endonuclease/exonuclease/phosphatase family protein [Planctomycetaceae bacterium]|nr:endonuclease/exonuclease/phosphatase family protein [Planctomycetaceae bacterium]